jgi:predicted metalloprotease with PDZ domain
MQSWRHCAVAIAATACAAGICTAGDTPPLAGAPPVNLAPIHVPATSLFLGYYIDVHWDSVSGRVDTIVVTKVEPGSLAERAGLRAGDYILAVDGKSTAGITHPAFSALMRRSFYEGDTVVYKFTVGRGVLMHRYEVVLRFKG